MDLIKTVYLCSGIRTAIDVRGADQRPKGITTTVDDNEVTVNIPLAKIGVTDNNDMLVTIGLLRQGKSWADKYKPKLKLRLETSDKDAPYWINAVALDFNIPEGCDWRASNLVRNLSQAPFADVKPLIAPGEIPDSKNDVMMIKNWDHTSTSTVPIPGDRIEVQHLYRVAPQVNAGPAWFHTETFCGGVIVARRAHSAIPNLLVYDVETEDQTLTSLLPTDYYLYDIGDVVFPFVIGDSRSMLDPSFPTGSFRLAPLALGGRGVSFGLSFSSFSEYANLRVLVGSIVSVSTSYNTAVVLINGGNYTLDIIYHCVDQSTTDARKAFKAGDAVLVLWSGYKSSLSTVDMVIIGHLGYVYPCTTTTTTTTTTSTTTTTTTTTTTPTTTTTTSTTSTTTTANPYDPDIDAWVLFGSTSEQKYVDLYSWTAWDWSETSGWEHETLHLSDVYFMGVSGPAPLAPPQISTQQSGVFDQSTESSLWSTVKVWSSNNTVCYKYDFTAISGGGTESLAEAPTDPPAYGKGLYNRTKQTWLVTCRVEVWQLKHISGPQSCGLPIV